MRKLITMAPERLLRGLGEQELFVRLHHLLHLSLMAENQFRIAHLQGAIKTLDLQRKMSRLRQEAIVEEIEIIFINQSMLRPP
ncbi:MAG: F-type H+-transporting ATPase subunit gamma [Motiliproteus sp.]|jgi:F-type H+-transporting ATPase subunit gamma